MPNIAQTEFEQLVRHYTSSITESEKRVIGENRIQPHRPRVENAFVAEVTEAAVTVDYLDAFADEDLPE